jgi:uncharacterized membrane protein
LLIGWLVTIHAVAAASHHQPSKVVTAIVVIGYGIWDLSIMWRAFYQGEVFDYKLPNKWPYVILLGILYVLS